MLANKPSLKCEISPTATPRDGNCLIHGKQIYILISILMFTVVAVIDCLLNSDYLKYNICGQLNNMWVNVISDLQLSQHIDQSMQLRRRWADGSFEWMAGCHGSLQNCKDIFQYPNAEWAFI